MSYFDKEETDAFIRAFLSNSGDGMNERYAREIIKHLSGTELPEELRAKYSHSDLTCVADAINTWNAGVRFAWSKTVEDMR